MELEEEIGELRSLVGKEDSVVFLLGVLNLGAVFLYSVYNHITRSQRYLGAPNSFLSNEYIERKVQSILDELVLHVQTSTYYQNVINRDAPSRVVKPNVPNYPSSNVDSFRFLHRSGLTSEIPDSGSNDHGRRKFKIVRRKKSRVERATKNERYPTSMLLKSIFSNLSPTLSTPSPRPVMLKHYYQPLATADRFDTNIEEMKFVDTLKKVDKSTIRAPEVRSGQSTDTPKTQKLSTRKPAEPKSSIPETQTRPYNDLLLTTQSSHVGFVKRLNEVVNIAAPLATSIFDIFGKEQHSPKCFEKTICEVNQSWRRKGVVAGTLSPLLSIVMSWSVKNQGSPPLADTLTAIRSGWIGQPCSLLYSFCEEDEVDDDHYDQPQALPTQTKEAHKRAPPPAPQRVPQAQGILLPQPLPNMRPGMQHIAQSLPVAHPNSRLDYSNEDYVYQSAEHDAQHDEEASYESGSNEHRFVSTNGEEENSIYKYYQSKYEKLKREQLPKPAPPPEYAERSTPQPKKPDSAHVSSNPVHPKQPEANIQTSKKTKHSDIDLRKLSSEASTQAPTTTSTIKMSTTSATTTTTMTTTTTTTSLPPGRPRSNLDSPAQVENSPSLHGGETALLNEQFERSEFSTVAGVQLQDQHVKASLLQQTAEEALAIWKPESSSFFDVTDAKPGIFYSIDRWSKRGRSSKLFRTPFLHKR